MIRQEVMRDSEKQRSDGGDAKHSPLRNLTQITSLSNNRNEVRSDRGRVETLHDETRRDYASGLLTFLSFLFSSSYR